MVKLVSEVNPNENEPLTLSLDQIARLGAKKLLAEALNLEVSEYIKKCTHLKDENNKHLIVRNGKSKARNITVGSGTIESGYRESTESWKLVFNSLIRREMNAPLMIVADGALGLWAALDKIPEFKDTKRQRCWVHKIANVLDKMPKRTQPPAKKLLHDMMNASCEKDADITFKIF